MSENAGKHGRRAGALSAWDFATSGTYDDAKAPRGVWAIVLAIALVVAVVPSVGMLWARTDSTTENRELAEAPALLEEDGSFNVDLLADAGTYFDDHFAYRNMLVAANARIRAALGVSATDQVVVGEQGWLYYGGTLPDYLGQNELSNRVLRNIAHNLALAQSYVEAQGADFAFTLAPNKNSLYPAHMPYYYLESPDAGNAERLAPLLTDAGVNYVDLFSLFEGEAGEWYLKQDSHWDNRGALMATDELFGSIARDRLGLSVGDAEPRDDFEGDLESMLYPAGAQTETNWYFEGYDDEPGMAGARWTYEEGADVTDSWVRTRSVAPDGSLLMFRDSFGNALLPFWASAFKSAAFSKRVPYNLPSMIELEADTVIIERAERHLDYLATNPPIMPNPKVTLQSELPVDDVAEGGGITLDVTVDGPYWKLEGALDERCASDGTEIYVAIEAPGIDPSVYDASWVTLVGDGGEVVNDFGYRLYVNQEVIDLANAVVRVYAVNDGDVTCVKTFDNVQ